MQLIGVILAAAAAFLRPGRECSISMSTPGVTLQPWFADVTMTSQTPRGKSVEKSLFMYTGDLASFLRNQIQVAVANIIEDRPTQWHYVTDVCCMTVLAGSCKPRERRVGHSEKQKANQGNGHR